MQDCSECGKEVSEGSSFCPHCGMSLMHSQDPPASIIAAGVADDDFRHFIGDNADNYLAKFERFKINGQDTFSATWHWPAFFIPFPWMLYRKMYGWAVLAFFLWLLSIAHLLIALVVSIAWGLTGNYIYYRRVKNKLAELNQLQLSSERRAAEIARKGGVNNPIVIVGSIFFAFVLIGIISVLVAPRLFPKLDKGKQAAAKAQIEFLGQALAQYRLDTGFFPSTQQGLQSLLTNPGVEKWEGPYLKKDILPIDPWGNPYVYQYPGTHGEYDLYSYGRDGKPGGEGEDQDVLNWE